MLVYVPLRACSTNDLLLFSFFFVLKRDKTNTKKTKNLKAFRRLSPKKALNFSSSSIEFPPQHHLVRIHSMGSSGGEKSAKKAKKEKRGDKPESGGGGSSKKRGRDGLPVPSTPGDEDEDTKLNPVCAIASPLADGKLTKKALKVVKKGTRVLFFFVQQRGERRRRFFFSALLAF